MNQSGHGGVIGQGRRGSSAALVVILIVFAGCGGSQRPPVAAAVVTRSLELHGETITMEMSEDDASAIDRIVAGGRMVSATERCLYWRGLSVPSPTTKEFARRATELACRKVLAQLPATIRGETFTISFTLGKSSACYGTRQLILASDADYDSAIVVRAPVGLRVEIKSATTSRTGAISDGTGPLCTEPKGEVRFGVVGGVRFTVRVRDGGTVVFEHEFDLPSEVTAVVAPDLAPADLPSEDLPDPQPAADKMPAELAACPSDWVKVQKGLCYKVESVALNGVIPVIALWLWSPQSYAVVTATIGIVEDGKTKCTDGFGLRNMQARKVQRLVYNCPINEVIDSLSDSRVVLIVQDAQ